MNKSMSIIIILAIVFLGAVAIDTVYKQQQAKDVTSVSNADESIITERVLAFGDRLKNVSLLAPATDIKAMMGLSYGEYLSADLLAAWQADPTQALGRNVSSPWPDRIDVVSVTKVSTNEYTVEGNVIEITSADIGTIPAAVYPVTLGVKNINGTWRITSLKRGAYSELPKPVTISGTWECLPHKDTTGPQTEECAFGIVSDGDKLHYAVDLHLLGTTTPSYATGAHVKVKGIMTPGNQLSSNAWQKYPIEGIVSVSSVEKISK